VKNQRGSILAGVIGLAVGITTAVAGFAVLAGNSGRVVADAQADAQMHLAAESGIYMGLRWLRAYPDTYTNLATWPTSPLTLNSALGDFSDFEGVKVKVRFYATPGQYQNHQLQALATYGAGRDTLEITVYFATTQMSSTETDGTATLYALNLARWTETLHPAF
jgi:hypothetical protein